MEIPGVGSVVAARILADVGDISRFADRNRFASWTGTAPLDVSSGEQNRHRLSRAGNRRVNHMIHIAAVTQLRHNPEGRAYFLRKRADDKKPLEAMRCLKRRISDRVYRQLVADAQRAAEQRWARAREGTAGRLKIQRGRLPPAHRHFGSATSRTRTHDATPSTSPPEETAHTHPLATEGSRNDSSAHRHERARTAADADVSLYAPGVAHVYPRACVDGFELGKFVASDERETPGSRHPMGPLPH